MSALEQLPVVRAAAILPAYNEGDVIEHVIGALIEEGLDVYLLDHGSTDDTVARAEPFLGKGLLRIERFPEESGFPEADAKEMVWRNLLARIEQVAAGLDHDWFIFTNADEFRESPFPDLTLGQALGRVDALGYNAVNFELFDFKPTDDAFVPGTDVREHLAFYEDGGDYDTLQIKAWKAGPEAAVLTASAGHSVAFEGRQVFPIPFILRHYPLRGETHGRRKVFGERLPRFSEEERGWGWHVQYDGYATGDTHFLRDPAELVEWDPSAVRARLLARAGTDLLLALAQRADAPALGPLHVNSLAGFASRTLRRPVEAAEAAAAVDCARTLGRAGDPELIDAATRVVANELRLQGLLVEARDLERSRVEAAESAPLRAAVEGARRVAVLAFGEELASSPALLERWAQEFGGADDVTLVIRVPGQGYEDTLDKLTVATSAAGLDGDEGPDLLVQPCDDLAALAPSVRAAFTSADLPAGCRGLPVFGSDSLDGLRRLCATA